MYFRGFGKLGRYIVVGSIGALIYYGILWLLVEVAGIAVLVASSIGFILVLLENYVLHYFWTFDSSARHREALPRFVAMNMIGLCLNLGVMSLGVEWLGLGYLWVQAVAIGVVRGLELCGQWSLDILSQSITSIGNRERHPHAMSGHSPYAEATNALRNRSPLPARATNPVRTATPPMNQAEPENTDDGRAGPGIQLSAVVPCFNEVEVLQEFHRRMTLACRAAQLAQLRNHLCQ